MKRDVRIIMPKEESLNKLSEEQRLKLKRAVKNVISYFSHLGLYVYSYATDNLALEYKGTGLRILQNVLPEDRYFIAAIEKTAVNEGEDIDSVYDFVRRKLPVKRGLSEGERSSLVRKRSKLCAQQHIKESGFIVDFGVKSNALFKVTSELKDKRLVLKVDIDTLYAHAKMSGTPIDIKYLFHDERLATTVDNWVIKGEA